jgi:hypoxanthine-DNA glycosylase
MTWVSSFPPVSTRSARVLVLGSMPGRRSLEAGEYYALPSNSFWRIMEALFGGSRESHYRDRLRLLKRNGIALWDVLQSCERPGSLDSAIVDATAVPNDFASFFREHPKLTQVFFNGAKAAQVYERRVLEGICGDFPNISYERLPSTSPAHAGMSYEQKLERWSDVKKALKRDG